MGLRTAVIGVCLAWQLAGCAGTQVQPGHATSIPDAVQLRLFDALLEEAHARALPTDEACLIVLGAEPPVKVIDGLRAKWPRVRPGPVCGGQAVVDLWEAQAEPPEDVFVSAGYRVGSNGGWHYLYRFKLPEWHDAGRLPFAPQ
jgi:hypothetical protein